MLPHAANECSSVAASMRKTIEKKTKKKSKSNAFSHVNEDEKFQLSAATTILEIMRQRLFHESQRRARRDEAELVRNRRRKVAKCDEKNSLHSTNSININQELHQRCMTVRNGNNQQKRFDKGTDANVQKKAATICDFRISSVFRLIATIHSRSRKANSRIRNKTQRIQTKSRLT